MSDREWKKIVSCITLYSSQPFYVRGDVFMFFTFSFGGARFPGEVLSNDTSIIVTTLVRPTLAQHETNLRMFTIPNKENRKNHQREQHEARIPTQNS